MIKANELRIGNWVGIGVHKCKVNSIHVVPGIQESHVRVSGYISSNPAHCVYTHGIEPIPLTPDILEKCGAVKAEGEWQFKVAIGALWISFRFNASHCYSGLGGIYLGDQIQYVHQLQNLKFDLTGTELEVKL